MFTYCTLVCKDVIIIEILLSTVPLLLLILRGTNRFTISSFSRYYFYVRSFLGKMSAEIYMTGISTKC